MTKIRFLFVFAVIVLATSFAQLAAQVSTWDGTHTPWTHGTGTEGDPFLIENAQQLAYLTYRVNNGLDAAGGHVSNQNYYYKLMTDIDLNGSESFQWTPIGYYTSSTDYQCFGGHFDGNGHTVSGVYINISANCIGFLGKIENASIENLTINGSQVSNGGYTGGIVGYSSGSATISNCNCIFTGNITGYQHVGGIVGYNAGSITIKNSHNTGNIICNNTAGKCYAGGVVGIGGNCTIINSYNIGSISSINNVCNSSYSYSGGIIGYCGSSSVITNCYNLGSVNSNSYSYSPYSDGSASSYSYSGGIVGCGGGTITNCYNKGIVNSISSSAHNSSYSSGHSSLNYSYGGGIVGSCTSVLSIITNCYNIGVVNNNCNGTGSCTKYYYGGGILGHSSSSTITITNCYNIGSTNIDNYGGIVGYRNNGTNNVINSYYLNTCGGNNTYGGSPMSADAMRSYEFVDMLANGSCAWAMDTQPYTNDGYPILTMILTSANTYDATAITQTHATLKGGISVMNDEIVSAGFMYKRSDASNFTEITVNTNADTMTYTLSGLIPSTGYTYKTYLFTVGCDTTFGEEKTFTTLPVNLSTANATNISQTQATLNGTFDIGDATGTWGFQYKANSDAEYQIIVVSETGNISKTVMELTVCTTYMYRTFFSQDEVDTILGTEKTFTTLPVSVITYSATNISQTHATLNGNFNLGDATGTWGFEYKKETDTTYQRIITEEIGEVFLTVTGLLHNTAYRYRAFCTPTGASTIYGAEKTFTTPAVRITTNGATDITQTHATLNASITAESEQFVSAGFMYKRSGTENYTTVACENYSENIALTLSGLKPSLYWESDITEYDYSDYVYKAYLLIDGCDTIFGTEKTFHTACVNIGIYIGSVTESSATLRGNTTIGDATITRKGFEYKASDESEYTMVICEEDFTTQIYGLTVNKTYNVRAFMELAESDIPYYAYNSFETSWLYADTIPIYDIEMLQWVADMCNSSRPASQFLPAQGSTFAGKYIKLMNNIVLPLNQPNNMSSIGSYPDHPFKGTFDGNGKLITNLYIDQPNTPYQGFFGYTLDANLYNVGLVNITASGRNYTGGMVAYAENTNMRDCYVNGGSLFALSYCGGLVGYQTPGTNSIISGCYNTCTVSGNHYVGGLLGYSDQGTVRNSYVASSVAAQGEAVGSIIGGANEVLMYQCYFSSEITGQENAIGENNFKSNEGMTNEQMRDPQFVETLNQGLTVPVWKGDYEQPINSGFPILKWQYSDIETCGAPENLTSIVNGTSITLIWTGEDNVDYYIVEYGLAGEQAQTETTTRNTISFNYEQPGSYYWRVKSVCPFGESNFVNGENVVIGGIEEIGGIQQIGIYPNPASESVTIQSEGQNDLEQINIFDVNGRMVMSESATGQIHRLDISNLQQGIYFVKVQTSDGYMTNKKLIVQ